MTKEPGSGIKSDCHRTMIGRARKEGVNGISERRKRSKAVVLDERLFRSRGSPTMMCEEVVMLSCRDTDT